MLNSNIVIEQKKIINEKKLQYLGFILHNNSISIRSSAFTRYSNKMKRGVSLAKQTQGKYNRIRIRRGVAIKGIYKRKLFSKYSHFENLILSLMERELIHLWIPKL